MSGGPGGGMPVDNFSARFTKTQNFGAGTYRFTARADDGIRVFVDGAPIIDKWFDQGPTTYNADLGLTAGNHTVIVEYFENGGGAVAEVSWVQLSGEPPPPPPPPPPGDGYNAEYWNACTGGSPAMPTTAANLTRTDPEIDFDWGGGGPGAPINIDHFIARWTRSIDFAEGTYRFTTRSDDGVRVYVDGVLVINQWNDHGPTVHTGDIALTAGAHLVKVEFYENGGGAVAEMSYLQLSGEPPPPPPPPPPGDGYNAEYWNAGTGGSPAMPAVAPDLTRTDPLIDFDWGGGGPGSPINIDHFIARWTRTIDFAEGTYRFTTRSDDGVRVYVDGTLVINQWNDHGPTVHTGDVALTAGAHLVKVEFYENGGGAVAEMSYAPTGAPPAATWNAQYFSNQTLSGSPAVTRLEAAINFDWGGSSPDPAIPVDHFSARFTQTKSYAAGTYQFTATADDGVRVFVDGVPVIDKWIDQPPTTYSANHFLTEGEHAVVVEYYENGGGAVAILEIQ